MEHFGRSIGPKFRRAVGALSARLFVFFERYYISDLGIEWVSLILSVTPIAIAFTIFCVSCTDWRDELHRRAKWPRLG